MNFWELFEAWMKENYERYGVFERRWPNPSAYDPCEGLVVDQELWCVPCHAHVRVYYKNFCLIFQNKTYNIADPTFTLEGVFSTFLAQHLYHHRKGPLYTAGWKLEKGIGTW